MEDVAWPLCRFTTLDTIYVILPGCVSIEWSWFGDVEGCLTLIGNYISTAALKEL